MTARGFQFPSGKKHGRLLTETGDCRKDRLLLVVGVVVVEMKSLVLNLCS